MRQPLIRFLSARLLTALATLDVLAVTFLFIAVRCHIPGITLRLQDTAFGVSGMVGCAIAIYLCLSVAADHRRGAFLRTAWILFSGDAVMQFFRYVIACLSAQGLLSLSERDFFASIVVICGLIVLLSGLLVTWIGLRRMQLGLRLTRRDIMFIVLLAASGILAMILEVLRTGWTLRVPVEALMFGSAIIAIMLLGLARPMEGGQIYRVLQMLIIYLGSRCVQNFFIAAGLHRGLVLGALTTSLQTALPWILCIGAALRLQVTLNAARKIDEQRKQSLYTTISAF